MAVQDESYGVMATEWVKTAERGDVQLFRVQLHPWGDRQAPAVTAEEIHSSLTKMYALRPHYNDVNNMPLWARNRIAALSIMPYPEVRLSDGIGEASSVKNVGRRISEHVFWLEIGNDED